MNKANPLPLAPGVWTFTTSAALDAGVSRGRLRAGDLSAPYWGVRSLVTSTMTISQRCETFMLRMPRDALFSHATAAALLGAPLPWRLEGVELHIGTPAERRPVDAAGVIGHRMRLNDEDIVPWNGLPITRPERIWLDLACRLTVRELVAVGDYFIRRSSPMSTRLALAEDFERYPGRRGRPLIRQALPLLDERSESPRESALRVCLVLAGLPPFEPNKNIYDSAGRFVARPDLVSVRYRLILEYEGDHHRSDRQQWFKDIERVSQLEDAGWRVIRVTADDLRHPARLIARIREHIARFA